jgi:hypothetical protein
MAIKLGGYVENIKVLLGFMKILITCEYHFENRIQTESSQMTLKIFGNCWDAEMVFLNF